MADFFISYSRDDKPLAQRVANALNARGETVWWDRELLSGDDFRSVIAKEIRDASACIVIWTPTSTESGFVRDEADRANKAKKLVPIAFSQDFEIPLGFGQIHIADFSGWRDDANAREIDDVIAKRDAIKSGRFQSTLKARAEAPANFRSARLNDAFALFSKFGGGIGGIPHLRYLVGALGCAIAFLVVQVLGAVMQGRMPDTSVLDHFGFLLWWWAGFALVRILYQFILLAKNRSAVWFMDEAFVFWIACSGLIALLLIVLTDTGPFDLGFYLEQLPLVTFVVLSGIGILRAVFWGARVAVARL